MDKTKYYQRMHRLMETADNPSSVPEEELALMIDQMMEQDINPYDYRDQIFPSFENKAQREQAAINAAKEEGLDLSERQLKLALGEKPNFMEGLARGVATGTGSAVDSFNNFKSGNILKGGSRAEFKKASDHVSEKQGFTPEELQAATGGKTGWGYAAGNMLGYAVPQIPSTLAIEAGLNLIPGAGQVAGAGYLANTARLAGANVISGIPTNLEEARDEQGNVQALPFLQASALDAALPVGLDGLARGGKIALNTAKAIKQNGLKEGIQIDNFLKENKAEKVQEAQVKEAQAQEQARRQSMFEEAENIQEKAKVNQTHPEQLEFVDTPEYKTGRQEINKSLGEAQSSFRYADEGEARYGQQTLERNSYEALTPEEVRAYGEYKTYQKSKVEVDGQLKQLDEQILDPNLNSEQLGELTKIRAAKKIVADDINTKLEPIKDIPQKVNTKLSAIYDKSAKQIQEGILEMRQAARRLPVKTDVPGALTRQADNVDPKLINKNALPIERLEPDFDRYLFKKIGKETNLPVAKKNALFRQFNKMADKRKALQARMTKLDPATPQFKKIEAEFNKLNESLGITKQSQGRLFDNKLPDKPTASNRPVQQSLDLKQKVKKPKQTRLPLEEVTGKGKQGQLGLADIDSAKEVKAAMKGKGFVEKPKLTKSQKLDIKDRINKIRNPEYKEFAVKELKKYPGDPKPFQKIWKDYKKKNGAFSKAKAADLEARKPKAVEAAIKEINEDVKIGKMKKATRKTVRCK